MSNESTDWIAWARGLASQWGLSGGIANTVVDLVLQGYTNESLVMELRKTPEYKNRFPYMDQMLAKGWNESNYVGYEQKMRELESTYGLPSGMLSGKDQVVKNLTNNLDEAQIEKRVKINYAAAAQVPDEVKQAMSDYYGVSDPRGALTAYYLDPTRSTELLQDQLLTAQIGGAAARYGFEVDRQKAEQWQQQGYTDSQAQAAAQKARTIDATTRGWGDVVTEQDLLDAQMGGAQAAKDVARVAGSRLSQFQGGGGAQQVQQGVSGLASGT